MKTFVRTLRSWTTCLIGAVLIIVLTSCASTPNDPLRVGSNMWLGYEPLYLARHAGLLNAEKVKLVEYVSTTQTIRGLVDGSIEAGAVTLDEALLLRELGIDVKVVLVMDYSSGADALISQSGITDPSQLKGKRIGAETSALGAYIVHRALEEFNLSLKDVEIVPSDLPKHESDFNSGKIDALVTFDPVLSRLKQSGANTLIDTKSMPGEIVDVLVIRASALAEHEENLQHLISAWLQTVKTLNINPEHMIDDMIPRMKMSEEEINSALDGVLFPEQEEIISLLSGTSPRLKRQADRLANVLYQNDLIASKVDSSSLFDKALIRRLYL